MKAYIVNRGKSPNGYFYSEVVTEQDYRDRGPHAHSYRGFDITQDASMHNCEFWCHKNCYTIVTVDEVVA